MPLSLRALALAEGGDACSQLLPAGKQPLIPWANTEIDTLPYGEWLKVVDQYIENVSTPVPERQLLCDCETERVLHDRRGLG